MKLKKMEPQGKRGGNVQAQVDELILRVRETQRKTDPSSLSFDALAKRIVGVIAKWKSMTGGSTPMLLDEPPTSRGIKPSFLIGCFVATAGQDGECLGADAADIILVCWVVVSVETCEIITVQRKPVQPNELSKITSDALTEKGLTIEELQNAKQLDATLQWFEDFIESQFQINGVVNQAIMVTDGPQPFRQCIFPEAGRNGFKPPHRYDSFFDVRKEFRRLLNNNENINSVGDILKLIDVTSDETQPYGLRHVQDLAAVIIHLIQETKSKGADNFPEPEVVKPMLEYGICTKNDVIDNNSVVRARGLPWQSSDHDVAKFFVGLNIARGGVALCLSQQGRRNGEALVRFETVEQRDLALRRHRHFMGNRYIEVYRANGEDFINVAAGSNNEAQNFLSKGAAVIIRMRGLPYDCTAAQIVEFFKAGDGNAVDVLDGEGGILFVNKADGRATGDAFVLVSSEEDAVKALSKHKDSIGSRYIELFRSTTAEVQQVVNKSLEPPKPVENNNHTPNPLQQQGLISALPQPNGLPAALAAALPTALIPPQQMVISGSRRDCTRLRGLPYDAQVQHILDFLGDFSKHIIYQGVHMVYNAQGHPSGEAFIQMDSEQSAGLCAAERHNKYMQTGKKQRYIEVFQCSADDMNLVLTGPASLPASPPALVTPRPMLSPITANTILQQQAGLLSSAMFPQHLLAPQMLNATALQNGALAAALQPMLAAAGAGARMPGFPMPANVISTPNGAVLYWPYPSPPVSPAASYYAAAATAQQPQIPGLILMRGLPYNATYADVMTFLSGFEIPPECIQFQRTPDGRLNGDAIVQMASRGEAERAVMEKHRNILGVRPVEIFLCGL